MYKCFGILIILLILALFFGSCGSLTVETFYENGVVVTSSPIASEIGLAILKQGGNAFDAAVGVGFALAVTYPEAGNIGGGGFALTYDARAGEVYALDFREKAPVRATVDMFLDSNGFVIENSSLLGSLAVGVPGTVAGLYSLWEKYGSLDWYQLLQPSLKLADTGFILDQYLVNSLITYADSLQHFPETKAVFSPGRSGLKIGARFIQKNLAASIQRIALDRLKGFYSGKTADLIVETMEKYNGLISYDDLSSYRPVWRKPVNFSFDSLDIYSMPPPSSGGILLGMILGLLEPIDFSTFAPKSPKYIHIFAEACRLAYAERAIHLGDPDFVSNPVEVMLSPDFWDARRELIDKSRAGISREIESGIPQNFLESESTTHFSIADKFGNLVSLTYTLNTKYGSKLVVGGAGFLLNNEMDDFSIKPGIANIYGLTGGQANKIVSGKRMLSSMSPTIILKNGRPVLALGSPGGSKIITTVAQALINYSRFGLNLKQIVNMPRFHHQWLPDTLYFEEGGFDINIKQDLIAKGHNIKERSQYSELMIISINEDGMITGAADPRKDGSVSGY